MRYKNKSVYALYKGDTFIDLGTYDELCLRQGLGRSHLYSLITWAKRHHKDPGNHLLVIKFE